MTERFAAGDRVRVRRLQVPGHIRAPQYLRGKIGTIERALGSFGNPERLAYGHDGGAIPLWRVRFRMADLWDASEQPEDTLDAEFSDHWLERV